MVAAIRRSPIRLLAYCLMPNHWHMVLWPKKDGEMTEFLRWLTLTHSQRLHAHRHTTGYGHIYQGRLKFSRRAGSSHAQCDPLCGTQRVASQPSRQSAGLALVQSMAKSSWDRESLLSDWPFDRPADWVEWVNVAQTEGEIEALRKCVNRGTPYGTETWTTQIGATSD